MIATTHCQEGGYHGCCLSGGDESVKHMERNFSSGMLGTETCSRSEYLKEIVVHLFL